MWSPRQSSCGTLGQSLVVARGQADPQLPQGPRCAVGRRTRCRTLAGKVGAPAESGRSPYECQTTLQEHQDRADRNSGEGKTTTIFVQKLTCYIDTKFFFLLGSIMTWKHKIIELTQQKLNMSDTITVNIRCTCVPNTVATNIYPY